MFTTRQALQKAAQYQAGGILYYENEQEHRDTLQFALRNRDTLLPRVGDEITLKPRQKNYKARTIRVTRAAPMDAGLIEGRLWTCFGFLEYEDVNLE